MNTIRVIQKQRLYLWLGGAGLCFVLAALKLGGWMLEGPGMESERSLGWVGVGIGAMLIYAMLFTVIGYEFGEQISIFHVLYRRRISWHHVVSIELDKHIVKIKGIPLPEFFLFLRLVGGESVRMTIPRESLHLACMVAEHYDKSVEQFDWAVLEAARALISKDPQQAKEHLRHIVQQHPGTFLAYEATSLLSVIR